MGDFEDDPFTGHMRHMNRMMNSFFNASPFGSLMGGSAEMMPYNNRPGRNAMMPFGFPDMERIFQAPGIEQAGGNCHSFTSSTVLTMSNGPDGRPQVYQASQSVRSGPGGVRETKKSVADSRTGVKKMAIGHHIGERAHIMEREQNLRSGQREEREEFINLDEDEAPDFNREWETKTRSFSSTNNAISYPSSSRYGARHHHDNTPMLPPPPSQSNSVIITEDRETEEEDNDNYDDDDDDEGVKIVELDNDDDEIEEPDLQSTSQKKEKSRKREHEPDSNYKSKVQKMHRDSGVRK